MDLFDILSPAVKVSSDSKEGKNTNPFLLSPSWSKQGIKGILRNGPCFRQVASKNMGLKQ